MCVVNQAPRTDWELNLGFIPALFAVRIIEAATIHMVHMMQFVSLKIVIESMQTNSWILKLMWIHLQVCKIGCIISMAWNVLADARFKSGFYSVRFGSISQSFLSQRIKFWFNSSPDPDAFQGLFKDPRKKCLLGRNGSPFWKWWRLPELTAGHP